jgi:hypothetical protein
MVLEDTSLLAINRFQMENLSRDPVSGTEIRANLDKFIKISILKFLCRRLPFLVGFDATGPLSETKNPWEKMLKHAEIIKVQWQERIIAPDDRRFQAKGLFILIKGKLSIDGCEYDSTTGSPLPFSIKAGKLIYGFEKFVPIEDSVVLRIDLESFLMRDPRTYHKIFSMLEVDFSRSKAMQSGKDGSETAVASAYDVFISYRRETGSILARSLEQALIGNFKVFLDVEKLGTGYFDNALFDTIKNAKNFIVLLTENCLDRCLNPDDWLRKEISQAIREKKNIIPLTIDGFHFPKEDLIPDDIREVIRHDAIKYDHVYFNAMISKIKMRLLP